MSKYKFSVRQRYAVFTVHGEKCYLCGKPLSLLLMEVDHLLPESLDDQPVKRRAVLAEMGKPDSFDLNSYENWMPACGPCNNRKSEMALGPAPIFLAYLKQAEERAPKARELEAKVVSERQLGLAVSRLQRFAEDGKLDSEILAALRPLLSDGEVFRAPEKKGQDMDLGPFLKVLHSDQYVTVVRGPYGVGSGPNQPFNAARCPACGLQYFNGIRCVSCGLMDDD